MTSSPPHQPGGFFFWIWVRQAADFGFQADALEVAALEEAPGQRELHVTQASG
jgi:hypothetical protein